MSKKKQDKPKPDINNVHDKFFNRNAEAGPSLA